MAKTDRRSEARLAPETAALMKRFGKRCKELRAASEMTQQQAAEKAGLAISHLQLIERAGSNPTLASVAALSRAYGVTLVEMFEGV